MAYGQLTIGTLSDGTNSAPSTNAILGSARCWVNFNGNGGITVNKSYNVSSCTRNSTALYTINFGITLSDANYAVALSTNGIACIYSGGGTSNAPTLKSTTQLEIYTSNGQGSTNYDTTCISVLIYD